MASAPRYTHGHAESVLRSHRWRTAANSAAYLLPRLRPDQHLLDVGAGPGTITAELATIVARVTAIEVSDEVAALTRAGTRDQPNVDVAVGDAHALAFPDATFDVVHAHQVLQHVADPVRVLRELVRVTKPGGVVAVRDSDYGGFVWAPESAGLTRWRALYCAAARANEGEPDAGRHLLFWAQAAGVELARITASSSTWCFATPADRAWWGGMWADRVTDSALARQLREEALADDAELAGLARAWRDWAADPGAWLSVLHGELLIDC
ncbi:MAG: class I SAM-dependent methyltransferase [Nocardioides sp.]